MAREEDSLGFGRGGRTPHAEVSGAPDPLVGLPYAHGCPLGRARLRHVSDDFQVDEELGFTPSGEGEHLMLFVRKRGWTTEAAAKRLADHLGVRRRAVEYAGLKDRHAVTGQWFSIHMPGSALTAGGVIDDGIEVVAATRNARKLRRGALAGNRFRLVLRDVDAAPAALDDRLRIVASRGVPNYFGAQRFGRDGDNLERSKEWLLEGRPVRGRAMRGLLLSAARSALFNLVAAHRVADTTWDRLLAGDRAALDGRKSHFPVEEVDPELARRTASGELHPTGPLPGSAGDGPAGEVARMEERLLAAEQPLVEALRAHGLRADRRALRLIPRDLAWWWPEPGVLALSFALPAGGYATSVVREVVSDS